MGKTFYDLTDEELCDLMCGDPEQDYDEEEKTEEELNVFVVANSIES